MSIRIRFQVSFKMILEELEDPNVTHFCFHLCCGPSSHHLAPIPLGNPQPPLQPRGCDFPRPVVIHVGKGKSKTENWIWKGSV